MIPKIYNLYRPKGISSTKFVSRFKRSLIPPFGKIGHFGTLDPFAEGILLIGISGASRLNDYVHKLLPKTYRARGILGQKTLSGDNTLEIVNTDTEIKIDTFRDDQIIEVLNSFKGDYLQSPPAFSACKHNGKPLYDYAREGVFIKKDPVKRHIHDIKLLKFEFPYIEFEATVGSGTYIRTLFEDIAEKLGTIGHLVDLSRTAIGSIKIDDCLRLEDDIIPKSLCPEETPHFKMTELLPLSKYVLSGENATRYQNGISCSLDSGTFIENPKAPSKELFWAYNDDHLIGMGKLDIDRVSICFNLPQN